MHRSTRGFSVPTYNMNVEKKAFKEVLPEVINSIVSSPRLTELPEVQSWMKKLLEYTVGEGKLGRGLMTSIGYRMFEEPEYFSEETQHSARVLGWCVEMTAYIATVSEHLDYWASYSKEKNNLEVLNMNLCNTIGNFKWSQNTFKLPIFAALLLVKDGKKKATEELNNICMQFGRLLQCQDDYLDIYVNDGVTGKTSRDIQEGKCTWVAVTALQHCNDKQRAIFKEYYGSQDPEHVKRIKQLYDELNIPQLYEQHERTMYDDLMRQMHALPAEGDRNFLLDVLNTAYKRIC